jgi:hypothetical protein
MRVRRAQGRNPVPYFRWTLVYALAAVALLSGFPRATATSDTFTFDVQITLSEKAAVRLRSLSEGVVVSAHYFGDPTAGAARRANQIGQIDLGSEEIERPGHLQTVRITGRNVHRERLPWIQGPVMLNVRVYSARQSGPDNILNCDFFDGELQYAVHAPVVLHCFLIDEHQETKAAGLVLTSLAQNNRSERSRTQTPPASTLAPIGEERAADSYAIYSMLMPGSPLDSMPGAQGSTWAISDATVSITDMDPAIPPDGQLKAPPDNAKAFNEAVQDFRARRDERFRLEPANFHLNHPFTLLDQSRINNLRGAGSSGSYPGITFFSAVYFNSAQTAALVYINDWCANLCAAGQWVYLEKHSGQWVRRSGIIAPGA